MLLACIPPAKLWWSKAIGVINAISQSTFTASSRPPCPTFDIANINICLQKKYQQRLNVQLEMLMNFSTSLIIRSKASQSVYPSRLSIHYNTFVNNATDGWVSQPVPIASRWRSRTTKSTILYHCAATVTIRNGSLLSHTNVPDALWRSHGRDLFPWMELFLPCTTCKLLNR